MAAVALLTAVTACSDDDNNGPDGPDIVRESDGAYILNQGNYYAQVEGMLSFVDYSRNTVTGNIFLNANGQYLGNTPQCGIVYDDHIFIGVSESQVIWVLDDDTRKIERKIQLADGEKPRSIVAKGGYLYVSLYNGYVAKLNSETLEIEGRVKVGPNPEIMAISGDKLYVPNSDGNAYPDYGTTASVIDLRTFTVTSTITVPENPNTFFTAGGKLYLLANGNYEDVDAALYEVKADNSTVKVMAATMVAPGPNGKIYVANTPFNGSDRTYSVYDTASGNISSWNIPEVYYPSGMAVDPVRGDIFVGSLIQDGIYPSYTAPGYVCVYGSDGTFKSRYNVGAGPAAIFFDLDD